MKKNRENLYIVLLILIATPLSCIYLNILFPDERASSIECVIEVNGVDRRYSIYLPSSFEKHQKLPLVIVLHGGNGTPDKMFQLTDGKFNELADKERFIVVYPESRNQDYKHSKLYWNDGRSEAFADSEDVEFISKMIDSVVYWDNANPDRVYVTGISNGAHMAVRLAFEIPEKINAVAPVAYTMQEKYLDWPAPKTPMPILMMTGTADPLIPWEGGEFSDTEGMRLIGNLLSMDDTVGYWVKHNQCNTEPDVSYLPDNDPEDESIVKEESYRNCSNGADVILYTIEGGGHTWPGGRQYLPIEVVGVTNQDISAAEVIWNFFKHH